MRILTKTTMLVSGISLGVLVSIVCARIIEQSIKSKSVDFRAATGIESTADASQVHDLINYSDSIVIDAILTILQSYYVDEDRALDSETIFFGALAYLSDHDEFEVKKTGRHSVQIERDGFSIRLNLQSIFNYESFLTNTIAVAGFINRFEKSQENSRGISSGSFKVLNAMMQHLDPHSRLLDEDEYKELRQGTEGAFGGLGVVVGMQDNVLTVIKPLPKSPAARAGIAGDDRIVFINNHSTFGTSLQSLVKHMRGEPGTEVKLSLLRQGEIAPRELSIRREIINVSSVESEILKIGSDNILKIFIESFSSRTAVEVSDAIDIAVRESNVSGIILDLRGNPGGLLDQAVKTSDIFLSNGKIVSTSGRRPEIEVAFKEKTDVNLPMIVLVDGNTASASEILAGALQDNNRAIILGQPTFGKGSVQTVFELPAEHALKLTIARYYTPNGRSIQSFGIIPDIWSQKIYKNSSNDNLLGNERYTNERYLSNSLLSESARSDSYTYKYYYIESDGDHELDLAKSIFERSLSEKVSGERFSLSRGSFLLAKTSKMLMMNAKLHSKASFQHLSDNYQIQWPIPEKLKVNKSDLSFTVDPISGSKGIREGDLINVRWRLRNLSNKPVKNLSVYLTSQDLQAPAKEKLLGTLKPRSVLSGSFPFEVSLEARDKPYKINIGVSTASNPVPIMQRRFLLKVESATKPKLFHSLKLVDGVGGVVQGVLEEGEKAFIEVEIENQSDVDAHHLYAMVSNFSGKQIQLSKEKIEIGILKRRSKTKVRFPVLGSSTLVSKKLHLGLTIDSKEHLLPLTKNHFVNAVSRN